MSQDEQQIRELIRTWMEASKAGDTDTVLDLVTEDVVFLLPGRPPMRRDEFAAMSRSQAVPAAPRIEGDAEIQEVQVAGDWAFLWTRLSVKVTPPGGAPMERAGHTLTVLRKEQGRWRLARDANLLVPVQPAA
ncbi:YybH family protein [Ramlibacter sp. AN1133]|uniref:YybH family protein n=1 Tax=Ramlibacter sp. AN1133 TaxID=3133429 RepID=UPI0030C4B074